MDITGLLPLLKDITCDVHLRSFSGKVAAIDVYCWLHKTVIFCVEEIDFGIEATRYVSTRRSYMCLKCLILNVSFSLALFSPQIFFPGTLTCARRILIFSSKIMCNLFWFSRRSWRARQMWHPPPLTCCCWGQQQVSGGFLVIFFRMNSVLSVRYFLYDLLGTMKNLAQKV